MKQIISSAIVILVQPEPSLFVLEHLETGKWCLPEWVETCDEAVFLEAEKEQESIYSFSSFFKKASEGLSKALVRRGFTEGVQNQLEYVKELKSDDVVKGYFTIRVNEWKDNAERNTFPYKEVFLKIDPMYQVFITSGNSAGFESESDAEALVYFFLHQGNDLLKSPAHI